MARENMMGQVLKVVRRAKAKGATAPEVSDSIGVGRQTVRQHLRALQREGLVQENGIRPTGERGRPPAVFVAAEHLTA